MGICGGGDNKLMLGEAGVDAGLSEMELPRVIVNQKSDGGHKCGKDLETNKAHNLLEIYCSILSRMEE